MSTDNKSTDHVAAQTVHVDAMVVAACTAEAKQTGRTLEAIIRECLDIPEGRLVVVAVDMATALQARLMAEEAKLGTPWPELLQSAFADALRQPSSEQP